MTQWTNYHRASATLLLCCSLVANATDVYMSRDKNGNMTFSDQPSSGAEAHKVKPLPTVPAFVPPPQPPAAEVKPEPRLQYTSLGIISPTDQAQLPTGAAGGLTVSGVLSPGLQPGDSIQLLNNGQVIQRGSQTSFTLEYMDRGEHQLQLRVVNSKDEPLISSNTVTIYIQRHSVIRRANGN